MVRVVKTQDKARACLARATLLRYSHDCLAGVAVSHTHPFYGAPLPRVQLNLTVARKWDAIVEAADHAGIHFQMTLQHHGQYSTTVDPNWNQNPYNVANGGFLANPMEFFTNATAKVLTKRKLRYAVARWGYSPAIMAWELFNEVQFTDAGQNGQWGIIGAWLQAPGIQAQTSLQRPSPTTATGPRLSWLPTLLTHPMQARTSSG